MQSAAAGDGRERSYFLTGDFVNHAVLVLLFSLSTAEQVYTGLKVSAYEFGGGSEYLPYFMCFPVLLLNLQVYLGRTLLSEMTREAGFFLPKVHRHPVFFHKTLAFHWCDLCSVRIKGADGAWRCR